MNYKRKKTMRIKLSSSEILEIAKALKGGWLDMDKIRGFKSLLDGYNPPKEIDKFQMLYFLDCLYSGLGYTPTDEATIKKKLMAEIPTDLKDKWGDSIEDGSLYKMLVRDAFFGMVAIAALGGCFEQKEADLSFCEKEPPFDI